MEQETQKIDQMVREIIALEPELGAKEAAVRKLVTKLYQERPEVAPSEEFVAELRAQLMQEVSRVPETRESIIEKIDNILSTMKWQYGFAGAFVLLLVIIPFLGGNDLQKDGPVFTESFDTLGTMAFGDLNGTESGAAETAGVAIMDAAPRMAALPGEEPEMMEMAGGGVSGENKMAVSPMIYPAPDYVVPEYVFSGVLPEIPANDTVYRKAQVSINSNGINSILSRLNLGLVDVNSFAGLDIQRLELVSKNDTGYTIRVDLEAGEISINRDWRQMPRREWNENSGVLVKDLNEGALKEMATSFLKKHGISQVGFGEAVLDLSGYRDENARVTQVSVRFPRLIEGKPVFEAGGHVEGLNVSVDLIDMVVSGVWGLKSQSYEKSSYPLITDSAAIEELVKKGGMRNTFWIQSETEAKTVQVAVGDPQMGLMHTWKYENNESYELYIPALIFPVENVVEAREAGAYVNNSIVVPLVEGLLNDDESRPKPMPLPAVMRDGGMTEPAVLEIESQEVR